MLLYISGSSKNLDVEKGEFAPSQWVCHRFYGPFQPGSLEDPAFLCVRAARRHPVNIIQQKRLVRGTPAHKAHKASPAAASAKKSGKWRLETPLAIGAGWVHLEGFKRRSHAPKRATIVGAPRRTILWLDPFSGPTCQIIFKMVPQLSRRKRLSHSVLAAILVPLGSGRNPYEHRTNMAIGKHFRGTDLEATEHGIPGGKISCTFSLTLKPITVVCRVAKSQKPTVYHTTSRAVTCPTGVISPSQLQTTTTTTTKTNQHAL